MTFEIALVLSILAVSLILFVSEVIRMDLVALLVLGALAVSGLVSSTEAFAGFSNSAVITVWAMFILSEGLTRTGIADIIGRQVIRVAGRREFAMIIVIMITAAVLSAFMNNVGVAALMLPVVVDVARRTRISPSRLLMPLAFATLLGGLMTMIGTPPNLLISEVMAQNGYEPFALFDFTPLGGSLLVVGVIFVAVAGRLMLPKMKADRGRHHSQRSLRSRYKLQEQTFMMRVPMDSILVGKTLAETRIGSATGRCNAGATWSSSARRRSSNPWLPPRWRTPKWNSPRARRWYRSSCGTPLSEACSTSALSACGEGVVTDLPISPTCHCVPATGSWCRAR
jgi:Na+/H+ antiporter NhaD/arsenite permease-like protein